MSTLTLLRATAYALKYRITSDGTDASITQAQLVADALTYRTHTYIGDLLAAQITDASWAALVEQKNFSIYTTLRTVTAGAVMKSIVPGTRLLVVSPCGPVGEADIELRFIHSIVQ